MTLYPCTKQPPCKNVSGHRTSVCPDNIGESMKGFASKLKADAMKNQITKAQPNPNTRWVNNPQAVEIDALIERAGRLTVGEIKAVDAVYNATHANTRHNAILASQYIARYAARYAAYTAAWDTHYYAAGDAAAALIVRDLIDEETPWNQEAYDTLTAPWAEVIGPAHPDDVVR